MYVTSHLLARSPSLSTNWGRRDWSIPMSHRTKLSTSAGTSSSSSSTSSYPVSLKPPPLAARTSAADPMQSTSFECELQKLFKRPSTIGLRDVLRFSTRFAPLEKVGEGNPHHVDEGRKHQQEEQTGKDTL